MSDRNSRQSFLGENSDDQIEALVVGIVGLSGGGSHIVQQLRHVGFRRFRLFDPEILEDSNLNRVVIATPADVGKAKAKIAASAILAFNPGAEVKAIQARWQSNPELLRECDIIFGCLDGFSEREQLEIFCRRNLIALIDIGMDVHPGTPARITGQVILSMPGHQCMRCMGFLNDAVLAQEAAKYGAAGVNPQVVWPNGVLASTAIGIAVELTTAWSQERGPVYMTYDGNRRMVTPHYCIGRMSSCKHFPISETGDPIFTAL